MGFWLPVLIVLSSLLPGLVIFFLREESHRLRTALNLFGAVLKLLLVGTDAVMMTSALLRRGPDHIGTMLHDMRNWLEENEYASVRQMQGSMSAKNVADATAYHRGNYMKMLSSYDIRPSSSVQ